VSVEETELESALFCRHTMLSRFEAQRSGAISSSEQVVLTLEQKEYTYQEYDGVMLNFAEQNTSYTRHDLGIIVFSSDQVEMYMP